MLNKLVKRIKRFTGKESSKDDGLMKNSSSVLIIRLAGMALNYLFTFLTARFYGAAGNGLYSIFQAVTQFFISVGNINCFCLLPIINLILYLTFAT